MDLVQFLFIPGLSSLPAHGIIPARQSQIPTGTRGYLTLLILQNLPPVAPDFSLLSATSIQPCMVCGVFVPWTVSICN